MESQITNMIKKNLISAYKQTILHNSTHALAGIAAVALWQPLAPRTAIIAGVCALLPDTDTAMDIPHRTATHSLAGIGIMYWLALSADTTPDIIAAAVIGYASHIIVDTLHGLGVQILYPIKTMVTVAQVELQPIAIIAALIITSSTHNPAYARTLIMPYTPTPTVTVTPSPTPTPTATVTPTSTPTITVTPIYDYSADIAYAEYIAEHAVAARTCSYQGENSYQCAVARANEKIAWLRYCQAGGACSQETPIPTPRTAATPKTVSESVTATPTLWTAATPTPKTVSESPTPPITYTKTSPKWGTLKCEINWMGVEECIPNPSNP